MYMLIKICLLSCLSTIVTANRKY